MSQHRYPPRALAGDYARAGFGAALTGAPILWLPAGSVIIPVLTLLALLFAAHGVRTGIKQRTRLDVTSKGIVVAGWRHRELNWCGVTAMTLDYYSTRRDGEQGWMQLKLKAPGMSLRIDSSITGFDRIAASAAAAARRHGIALSPRTQVNLGGLGRGDAVGAI